MARILITSYVMRDLVMYYINSYLQRVFIPWLERYGYDYQLLYEENNTRENFEALVVDKDTVLLFGHGRPEYVTGYKYLPILVACENDHLLKDKKVVATSCLTGRKLALTSINKGAKLYVGYLKEACLVVQYCCEDLHNCDLVGKFDPLQDNLALPFLNVLFYPCYLVVQNYDPETIYNETIKVYDTMIDKALEYSKELEAEGKREDAEAWSEVAKYLMWDKNAFTVIYSGEERPAPTTRRELLPVTVSTVFALPICAVAMIIPRK